MGRKIIYWITTGLIAASALFAGFAYLSGNQQAVQGFAHLGYPQHLRVILGIAKLLGALALLSPGIPRIKEWAYAGFGIAWICAVVAHSLAHETSSAISAAVLIVLLVISYTTRPASRQLQAKAATA